VLLVLVLVIIDWKSISPVKHHAQSVSIGRPFSDQP